MKSVERDANREWQIKVDEEVLYLAIHAEEMTPLQATGMSEEIITTLKERQIKHMVADYRNIKREFPLEVDRIWVQLIHKLPDYVDHCVAVCNSPLIKLETNYIFKQVGAEQTFKAFSQDELLEASKFMGRDLKL